MKGWIYWHILSGVDCHGHTLSSGKRKGKREGDVSVIERWREREMEDT